MREPGGPHVLTDGETHVARATAPAGAGTAAGGAAGADGAGGAVAGGTARADGAATGGAAAGGAATDASGAPARLDVELVRRGLARSRTHAAKLVAAGRVRVGGTVADRPSRPVSAGTAVSVSGASADDDAAGREEVDWVSRGAVKLDRALTALAEVSPPGVPVAGRRCLDAGASTGGFTEVLLRRGAAHVVAVDVGHDQLAPALRADPRVTDREGTSVRGAVAGDVGGPVDLLVADLSFISLRTVLPDLEGLVRADGDLVLMVKPQFEVGRARLPRGGVVRDAADRVDAVLGVAAAVRATGRVVRAATPSALPGPAGNLEFFLWAVPGGGPDLGDDALTDIVREAR